MKTYSNLYGTESPAALEVMDKIHHFDIEDLAFMAAELIYTAAVKLQLSPVQVVTTILETVKQDPYSLEELNAVKEEMDNGPTEI